MALVGPYDASTFVEGSYSTYPALPAGAAYYQPSMHWEVVGAGVVHGQTVDVGDLLFATQGAGRLYGANLYGDQIYGGLSDGDWTVEQVFFLAYDSSLPGPIRPPYPNAGCWFTRDDLPFGDWAPGWRIVVDAFYNDLTGTRVYGADTYGSEVYGDADNDGLPKWVDMTRPVYSVTAGDGTRDGVQDVPVAEAVIELVDPAGAWFDFADPWRWYQPAVGTAIRVGFLAPDYRYHPVLVGQIERIEDAHDGDHPRTVVVRAFSQIMDLTVDVLGLQRPAEYAAARFRALVDLAGWRWGAPDIVFPGDAPLIADRLPHDVVIRDELDRTAQSVGWVFDANRNGQMRVRKWPLEPTGEPIVVVDCPDAAGDDGLPSPSILYVDDQSQLLNYVIAANTADPVTEVRAEDDVSISRFGKRGRSLGYPKTGLAFADSAVTSQWVTRVAARYSSMTRRVEQVDADTALDGRWLETLAALDSGQAISVERHGFHPFTLDGVVVGWEHAITPGRFQSSIYTATTTGTY